MSDDSCSAKDDAATGAIDGAPWRRVGAPEDFAEDQPWPVVVDGRDVVVVRHAGRLFGLEDHCTHGQARLSEGWAEEGWIECPLHQGRFSLATGAPLCDPLTRGVACFRIKESGGDVWVALPESESGERGVS